MPINIGDGVLRLIADPTGVDRELAQMGRKGAKAGKQASAGLKPVSASLSNIKKLALGVGGVFVAWQAIRILKNTAKAAIEFGKQFANVATLINTQTPVGVQQLKILKQQIFALRPELGSATELTRGLYQALSAGAEPAEAVRLVGEAALFAKAGLTDTLTAVDVITTAINAYSLSAADAAAVSSTLFKTIELGKITGQELAGSLGRVIPTAAALNVSLPELNAALATMTKSGLSTAEAVTSLRAILKTLTSPEAIKRFEKLGISQAEMRDIITKDGLNAALQELGKRLKGNTAATTDLFRETEAQVGVFTLLGAGAEEYKQNVVKLTKAQKEATATAIAAEKQFATLNSRLETISVTVSKEFTIAFENMIPAIDGVLTSFGATGVSGQNLRIVLNAIAFSITFLTQAFLFWKGVAEGVLLSLERGNLVWLEFQQRLLGTAARFTNINRRVRESRDLVDDLTNAMQTDLEQVGKLEAKLVGLGQKLEFVSATGGVTKKTIKDLGAAAEQTGVDFEKAGIKTVAALEKEVVEARKLSLALIDAGASAFELNQAVEKLAEAEKALADAQKEVLGGFKELKGEVKAVASEIVEHDAKLPPLIEKYNSLKEALRTLGIEGSAALKEQLTAAESALEAIRVAVELGLASNVDILAGEIEVMEIRTELWRALGQTIDESYLQKLEEAKEKLAELRGETEEDLGAIGSIYEQVTGVIARSMGQAIQAAILGQRSFGAALKQTLAEELSVVAKRAVIKAIESIADAIRALAGGNFAAAGKYFLAAAKYGAVAAAAGIAAKQFVQPSRVISEVGGERRVFTTPTAEEEKPLIVERRLAMGGLITRPTLAMLGERGPEMVVPLRQGGGGVGGSAADRDGGAVGTAIQIFIEGMISPDVLDDVIQQISERVEGSDVRLTSSTSLRVVSRS